MADKKPDKDPFATSEAKFSKALGKWSDMAANTLVAQGASDVAQVVVALKRFLSNLVKSLFSRLRQILGQIDPFAAAGAVGTFVSAGIEDLMDALNDLLEDITGATGAASDAVVGAVLGIVEAIKKAFHLILDGMKLPAITGPVELFLDLIDNVLGNIAELVSPNAGKTAKMLRTNMYGQLAAIRSADAARSGRFKPDERREED